MGLVERNLMVSKICPPIDNLLGEKLIDEFISMERRYIQRDWEPAELDGGQYAEIASKILYHLDSGNLNYNKQFDDCLKYFSNDQVSHALDRKEVGHISKVLQSIYKFRSQRGAVHISATYSPNQMDSKYLIEAVRWCMNEILRLFWNSNNREEVAKTIRELLQFDVPCVGVFENIILVQRTDLKAEEEILVLLHYAGENGFSRNELGKYSMINPATLTNNLGKLCSQSFRQIVKLQNGNYRLTDLGQRRIRVELADKLLVE